MLSIKVAIIGAGNLAEALIAGWVKPLKLAETGILPRQNLIAINRSLGKLRRLSDAYGVRTSVQSTEAVSFADYIVIAVKPGNVQEVLEEIAEDLSLTTVIISVAAGVSIGSMKQWLGKHDQPIVRVMPNTPAKVGEAMSGWTASPEVTLSNKKVVRELLTCIGKEVIVEEPLLDQVTAISGSGPAYVFYLAELLMQSAENIGLPASIARVLVVQTLFGAAKMLVEEIESTSPDRLRAAVTSKGGTTEAALRRFFEANLAEIIDNGVHSAWYRAQEIRDLLAKNKPHDFSVAQNTDFLGIGSVEVTRILDNWMWEWDDDNEIEANSGS